MLVRKADIKDIDAIFNMMQDLARHDNVLEFFTCSKEDLIKNIFNENFANALVLYYEKKVIGLAIYYFSFISFAGKKGVNLEVFYIDKNYRKKGFGKALFKGLVDECLRNNAINLSFFCDINNKKGFKFYTDTINLIPMKKDYESFIINEMDLKALSKIL
ncbi:GNAT family N-acetyltransferase [uncultured Campylobacter sp.]|uniref:GNAT family N-acetyltransferase n=1 Tax=uncultured Campylobacter sp. TaxID=218934 RepID=UPI00261E6046|nr:GNAT family N-acetyltransferase [uncultured Campylobacter sp.]